jgi:predicted PurR-regulated permease PerM
LILAYLLLPPILWIEKKLPRQDRLRQTKRILLILFIYLVVLAIIGVSIFFTFPIIINSIAEFISTLPELIPDLLQRFQDWFERVSRTLPPEIQSQLTGYLGSLLTTIGDALRSAAVASVSFISGTFGLILGFAALPVFLFYILKDAEKLKEGFLAGMSAWTAEQTRNIALIIEEVLGKYIRSQIILGLTVGILDFIGLYVLGIPFAPALAAWAAVTELVPILGPWLGGAAGVIVVLATEPDKTIWVVILYFAVQILENNVLVPRIQGEFLRIHPAVILVLVVIGGYFAGIWGIILIVPVTATIIRLYRYIARTSRREEMQGPSSQI